MNWLPDVDPGREAELWSASGAAELTGYADGPPSPAPGAPAALVQAALESIVELFPGAVLPGVDLLSVRAPIAGYARNAPWSCGGGVPHAADPGRMVRPFPGEGIRRGAHPGPGR